MNNMDFKPYLPHAPFLLYPFSSRARNSGQNLLWHPLHWPEIALSELFDCGMEVTLFSVRGFFVKFFLFSLILLHTWPDPVGKS